MTAKGREPTLNVATEEHQALCPSIPPGDEVWPFTSSVLCNNEAKVAVWKALNSNADALIASQCSN
jgi:hypothetical protein